MAYDLRHGERTGKTAEETFPIGQQPFPTLVSVDFARGVRVLKLPS
jgi:hypothetical protein